VATPLPEVVTDAFRNDEPAEAAQKAIHVMAVIVGVAKLDYLELSATV
jgi:hypothetical protein